MKEKLMYVAFFILICAYVVGTIATISFVTKQNDALKSRNTYLEERNHYLDSILDNHICHKPFKK